MLGLAFLLLLAVGATFLAGVAKAASLGALRWF